uniref:Tyrosine-protein kinase n=1 Tax=Panagrolaimus sp. JU765 TaxID=591449 RepID=A0AC34QMH4_9BILA
MKRLLFGGVDKPIVEQDLRLESQIWYHGIRTREECAPDLIEKGDFLVRASSTPRATNIVLNVLSKTVPYPRRNPLEGVSNYTVIVSRTTRKFALHKLIEDHMRNPHTTRNPPEFDNVIVLVEYYKVHRLPCGTKLIRAIERPQYLIKHASIFYDPVTDYLNGGNFGQVYKGIFKTKQDESIKVAIKVCRNDNVQQLLEAVNARLSMMREAKLMAEYDHENVITFYGVACDHPPVMLVMEFCQGGSLEDHLLHERDDTIIERVLYCYEAARGMRYLHAQNCVHSDLASRNCLISTNGVIKICDFGLSNFLSDYLVSHANEFPTVPHMAVNKIPGVSRKFTFKEDALDQRTIKRIAKTGKTGATMAEEAPTMMTTMLQTLNSQNPQRNSRPKSVKNRSRKE